MSDTPKAHFDLGDLLPLTITIVVAGVAVTYGLSVLADVKDDQGDAACSGHWNTATDTCQVSSTNTTVLSANDAATNATAEAITAVAKFPEKFGLIVTVIVAALLIVILVRYLMVR